MQISTSYSRKVNHQQYGGMPYENSDHFCSISREVSDDCSEEAIKTWKGELQRMCKEMVDKSAEDEITGLSGGLPLAQFNRVMDQYLQGGSMTPDEYETMSPAQKNIIQAIKRSKKRIKSKELN